MALVICIQKCGSNRRISGIVGGLEISSIYTAFKISGDLAKLVMLFVASAKLINTGSDYCLDELPS